MNEKQKAPYEAKAAADKKRYEEEKAAYTAVSVDLLLLTPSILTGLQGGADDDEDDE